jgi:hypothetical protein
MSESVRSGPRDKSTGANSINEQLREEDENDHEAEGENTFLTGVDAERKN